MFIHNLLHYMYILMFQSSNLMKTSRLYDIKYLDRVYLFE